jgi:hypothetical protein
MAEQLSSEKLVLVQIQKRMKYKIKLCFVFFFLLGYFIKKNILVKLCL